MSEVYKDLEKSLTELNEKDPGLFHKSIEEKYRTMSLADIENAIPDIEKRIDELKVLVGLGDVTEIVSVTYIAKTYFRKSRAWLAQRINGNIVNGKPVRFSPEELDTLKRALNDISIKMQEASSKIELV